MGQAKLKKTSTHVEVYSILNEIGSNPSADFYTLFPAFYDKFITPALEAMGAEYSWTNTLYLKALTSRDPAIRTAMMFCLQHLFSSSSANSQTIALFCRITPESRSIPGEFSDCSNLKKWVSNKLSVPESNLDFAYSPIIESVHTSIQDILWTLYHITAIFDKSKNDLNTPSVLVSRKDGDDSDISLFYPVFVRIRFDEQFSSQDYLNLQYHVDLDIHASDNPDNIPCEVFTGHTDASPKVLVTPIEFMAAFTAIKQFPFYSSGVMAVEAVNSFILNNPSQQPVVWIGKLPSTNVDALVLWVIPASRKVEREDESVWVYIGPNSEFAADAIIEYIGLKFDNLKFEIMSQKDIEGISPYLTNLN